MRRISTLFLLATLMGACGSDSTPPPGVDASTVDSTPGAPDATPGSPDAASACVLPPATISCTVGTDTPCTAECAGAYCYNFMQLPNPVCTESCSSGLDCPSGWTCNNMGRCRPPG